MTKGIINLVFGKLRHSLDKLNMVVRIYTAKRYKSDEKADIFLKNIRYDLWASKQEYENKIFASRICREGVSSDSVYGQECIETIHKIIKDCPPTLEDMIIYRSGSICEQKRPYVSASLLYKYSKEFGEPVCIYVPKGSILFPSFAISPATETSEAEVIIDNRCIEKVFGLYVYTKNKHMY